MEEIKAKGMEKMKTEVCVMKAIGWIDTQGNEMKVSRKSRKLMKTRMKCLVKLPLLRKWWLRTCRSSRRVWSRPSRSPT